MDSERWTRPPQIEGTSDLLKELVGRIREIDAEAKRRGADLRDIYNVAKGHGISVKALKLVARDEDAGEDAAMVKMYLQVLGAPAIVVKRLESESLDTILWGNADSWPSDGIDL